MSPGAAAPEPQPSELEKSPSQLKDKGRDATLHPSAPMQPTLPADPSRLGQAQDAIGRMPGTPGSLPVAEQVPAVPGAPPLPEVDPAKIAGERADAAKALAKLKELVRNRKP
jgi:hypothetical protein